MKVTGTATQCKNMAATIAASSSIILGRLLLTEKFLNFIAIMGILLTMSHDNTKVTEYKNHLFSNRVGTNSYSACQ